MHEIVNIHIGQAGVQMGNSIWEQLCTEHNVDCFGKMKIDNDKSNLGFSSFFCSIENGQYVPRVVIVDLEPTVIDEIRAGPYRKLFNSNMLITGVEDASSNFARGHFTAGKKIIKSVTDQIRKLSENCNNLGGFFMTSSFGGGTGSGFQTLISEKLTIEYAKYLKVTSVVYPSAYLATATVESFNAILNNHFTIENCDLAMLFDNASLYKICQTFLGINRPTYTNLNRILAHIMSCLTVSLRFESTLNSDLDQIVTNIVPYPRIHFPILNAAPILSESIASHKTMSVTEITRMIFESENAMISVNTLEGDYFCCSLQYRGKVTPREVNEAVNIVKQKHLIHFVDWCPTGFKVGINCHPPSTIGASGISHTDTAVSMLANTSAIEQVFSSISRNFDALFQKRCFIHWFVGEGMEEGEFTESRDCMAYLIADYKGIENGGDFQMIERDLKYETPKRVVEPTSFKKRSNEMSQVIEQKLSSVRDREPTTSFNEIGNEVNQTEIVQENEEILFRTSEGNVVKVEGYVADNIDEIDDLTLLDD